MTSVTVEIRGSDLPGSSCGPDGEGRMLEDIHVGLWHKSGPTDFVSGGARSARWRFEMVVRIDDEGTLDYGGPFVAGRRGERSLGLVWGTFAWNDFEVFRGAKLRLSDLDPALVERALATGAHLSASSASPTIMAPRAARVCAHRI